MFKVYPQLYIMLNQAKPDIGRMYLRVYNMYNRKKYVS